VPDDRLAAATAELYAAAPEAFTERRGELAAAARDAGDRAAAKAIAGLRRPTRAAWVVNRLARAAVLHPARVDELGPAGEDLKRPGDVEGLHAVEQDDQNCSHASKSSGPRSWQQ